MKKVNVILADDHTMVRKGIRSAITSNPDINIVAEVSNAGQVLSALEEEEIEMVITDISMPGTTGLELCEIIGKKYPATKVLILSMHRDHEYIVKAFEAGAMGYLTKDADEAEFFKAIKMVSEGHKYFSPYVSEILASQFVNGSPTTAILTSRETEVLTKVVQGLSNKQIAEDLFISARTVDTHRTNVMRKLGANNAAELVRIAITQELV